MEFYLKYVFRVIHITSASIFIGSTFADALFGISSPRYSLVQSVCGVLLLISGLVNMIYLKPTLGTLHRPWTIIVHTKLLLWFSLLPLPEITCRKLGIEFPRRSYNQGLSVILILMSAYSKQYRDWAVVQKAKSN